MTKKPRQQKARFVRNIIFGVEDSLVSTVGLLSGINTAGVDRRTIILTGVILVFVEAFSMGVGTLLSEHSTKEYLAGEDVPLKKSVLESLVMFFSYFLTGFIPLSPYLLFSPSRALEVSIALSLLILFTLGIASGKVARTHFLREGLQMALIGGIAIIIGVVVGKLIHNASLLG